MKRFFCLVFLILSTFFLKIETMESKSLIFRIRKNSFPFQHSGLAKSLRTGDHELPNSYKSMKQGERKIENNYLHSL